MKTDNSLLDNTNYIAVIGANIRYERKKRKFTIEELAEMIGMAPGFLGLIERGQRGTSIKNLVKIADIFSLTLDQLITIDIEAVEKGTVVKEPTPPRTKRDTRLATLRSLARSMNIAELDYFITNLKALRKLTHLSAAENTYAKSDKAEADAFADKI